MGFAHLDRHAARPSWLTARTSPSQRLWIAIAAAFAAGLMPPGAWHALGALAAVVALGVLAARLPLSTLARRVGQALPFFLLPALALPVSVPGPVALEIGPLTLSGPGLSRAAEIVLRATLAVSAVTIVVSVTRATDLLRALDSLPIPRLVKSSLALGYRYVYLLNDEMERTARAIRSRMGRASRLRLWRARAATLAHLLLRAHDRGTRIHAAMLSRGYSDRLPTLQPAATVSRAWSLTIVGLLALVWLGGLLEVME
ncbi:MAG: cobalt ECF transporter T component CbiQ [Gemmatimonadota bacterium]|nr:MAG: cobalt ECF transporter T component CbiQ [Gemmatimonadota bacterium]